MEGDKNFSLFTLNMRLRDSYELKCVLGCIILFTLVCKE